MHMMFSKQQMMTFWKCTRSDIYWTSVAVSFVDVTPEYCTEVLKWRCEVHMMFTKQTTKQISFFFFGNKLKMASTDIIIVL